MIAGQIAADPVGGRKMADEIDKVKALKAYLCDDAIGPKGKVRPSACRKCDVGCGYGKRLLQLMAR